MPRPKAAPCAARTCARRRPSWVVWHEERTLHRDRPGRAGAAARLGSALRGAGAQGAARLVRPTWPAPRPVRHDRTPRDGARRCAAGGHLAAFPEEVTAMHSADLFAQDMTPDAVLAALPIGESNGCTAEQLVLAI